MAAGADPGHQANADTHGDDLVLRWAKEARAAGLGPNAFELALGALHAAGLDLTVSDTPPEARQARPHREERDDNVVAPGIEAARQFIIASTTGTRP